MKFSDFKKLVAVSKEDIYREMLAANRASIRVKKEKTAVRNLEKIFRAVLKISNRKGFQAMTMRDLSRESQMSMGALYAYFTGKDDLVSMLQKQRRAVIMRILEKEIDKREGPSRQLRAAIRTHLFLSEIMQPWFYFSFMEAKNLDEREKLRAIESDRFTDELFVAVISRGQEEGLFAPRDAVFTAGLIKAMLQDWYLKRAKFRSRDTDVETYADAVVGLAEAWLAPPQKEQQDDTDRPIRPDPQGGGTA